MVLTDDESQAEIAQDFVEAGRKLFAGECEFVLSAQDLAQLPPAGACEIAFAGRSNVGKSSLINALTGRKSLARTSNTPGRTQALNVFTFGGTKTPLRMIDMPGYGYAAAPKETVAAWTRLIQEYLRGRPGLARVFVLVDGRHGLKAVDDEMLDRLDKAAVSYQVILTKGDCLKPAEQEKRLAETVAALAKRPAAFPQVLFTSAAGGAGIEALRAAIALLLTERESSQRGGEIAPGSH